MRRNASKKTKGLYCKNKKIVARLSMREEGSEKGLHLILFAEERGGGE